MIKLVKFLAKQNLHSRKKNQIPIKLIIKHDKTLRIFLGAKESIRAKLRTPKSYADAFKVLEESGIISTELSKNLLT